MKIFGLTKDEEEVKKEATIYQIKPLMNNYDYKFYEILKSLEDKYTIMPQISLASITKKINNTRYYNDLFRNIDFAIFTKDYKQRKELIEI